jgi:hypothetical protein
MDMQGQNCYPSTKTLARYTGYSERTVCTHIDIVVKAKWLKKESANIKGQAWKRNKYSAVLSSKALKQIQHHNEGTEFDAEGTEADNKKAMKEIQSNSFNNSLKNSLYNIRKKKELPEGNTCIDCDYYLGNCESDVKSDSTICNKGYNGESKFSSESSFQGL